LVTLAEVGFATSLEESLSASTQRTIMAAVKSLLSFGLKIEVLPRNVGAPVVLLLLLTPYRQGFYQK
jgi:hypothetical protein